MTHTPPDHLEQRLHDLAARLPAPSISPSEDLARGRARARRRGALRAAAATATLAVVLAAPPVIDTLTSTDNRPAPPADVTSLSDLGIRGETDLPLMATDGAEQPEDLTFDERRNPEELDTVRRAIARTLDPGGTHISETAIRDIDDDGAGPDEADSDEGGLSAGSIDNATLTSHTHSFRWVTPGPSLDGIVTLEILTSDTLDCGGGPDGGEVRCQDTTLAGLPVTTVTSTFDPQQQRIAHRREDGYVVVVEADPVRGHRAQPGGAAALGIDDERLAAVLSNPVVDIPGHPAPPQLDILTGTQLRDVAHDVLGHQIGTVEEWSGSTLGYWYANLREPLLGGVFVAHQYVETGLFDAPCEKANKVRCTIGAIDGRRVRIDLENTVDAASGGYAVLYDGPKRRIEVRVDAADQPGRALPLEDALQLAIDSRLQA